MKTITVGLFIFTSILATYLSAQEQLKTNTYNIVDTGQISSYSNDKVISLPNKTDDFYGQDSSYIINNPSYTDNNDGTITDNVTGLVWQKEMGEKLSYTEALQKVNSIKLAEYEDWRIPTSKELYSLIQFTGSVKGQKAIYPFICYFFIIN